MEQLLTTKFYIPPTRPELVSRTRLIERMNEALLRKLTLISAPAGFGKTTLVSEWVENLHSEPAKERKIANRIAWLSLDEGDNTPAHFLAYFVAALSQVDAIDTTNRGGVLSLLQSPQPPPVETVLTSLINQLAATSDRIILVLEDYHIVESSPVNHVLTFLLEHSPPQMHLVIATRVDPHLPLARLRALGQLNELRAADLRFTLSEAAEFLNQVMGLNLSAEDIEALETRTEGWIVGLQLAAISMRGHEDNTNLIQSFTGSHRFVLDYLIEEVLDQQPDSVKIFLLQTAILKQLTGSLCDALTGQGNGQATLEMLERTNLFIVPLDEERRWYRYHYLFGDLLRRRLRQTHPEQIPDLHQRASEWYEQNDFADKAIDHALKAEDFEKAAYLIEEHFDAMYQRGEHVKLRHWLAEIPVDLVSSNPHICIMHAWDLFSSGRLDAAERSLQAAEYLLVDNLLLKAETSITEQVKLSEPEKFNLRGGVAAIRAYLSSYQGDAPGTLQYATQALQYLPYQELTWRSTATLALGDAYDIDGDMAAAYRTRIEGLEISKTTSDLYLTLIANLKVAVTLRMQGQLSRVLEICQGQWRLAKESGLSQSVVAGWLLAIWGETLAELNDLDGAVDKTKKGTNLTERGKDVAMIGWSYLCLMRVFFSRGDLVGAEELIHKMEMIARDYYIPPWIANPLAAWQARIWLARDNMEAASQWVIERGLDADGNLTYLREMEYIMLARIFSAQMQLDKSSELLERLLKPAEKGGRTTRIIEILILQALVLQKSGDTTQAVTRLERAISLAEPSGFIRIFLDEGQPMARLLYETLTQGNAPDYTRRLLAAFPIIEPELTGSVQAQTGGFKLAEPLSKREIQVLQLIAEGLTNPEIAIRLYLSLNTVKVHTRNIFGKLAAHNRMDAVARARVLGILPVVK